MSEHVAQCRYAAPVFFFFFFLPAATDASPSDRPARLHGHEERKTNAHKTRIIFVFILSYACRCHVFQQVKMSVSHMVFDARCEDGVATMPAAMLAPQMRGSSLFQPQAIMPMPYG